MHMAGTVVALTAFLYRTRTRLLLEPFQDKGEWAGVLMTSCEVLWSWFGKKLKTMRSTVFYKFCVSCFCRENSRLKDAIEQCSMKNASLDADSRVRAGRCKGELCVACPQFVIFLCRYDSHHSVMSAITMWFRSWRVALSVSVICVLLCMLSVFVSTLFQAFLMRYFLFTTGVGLCTLRGSCFGRTLSSNVRVYQREVFLRTAWAVESVLWKKEEKKKRKKQKKSTVLNRKC